MNRTDVTPRKNFFPLARVDIYSNSPIRCGILLYHICHSSLHAFIVVGVFCPSPRLPAKVTRVHGHYVWADLSISHDLDLL